MKKSWLTVLSGIFVLTLISSPSISFADAEDGAKLFKKRCGSCHSTEAGKHKNGPSLAGIIGRKAGSTDFAKYKGLKGSDVVWDDKNMDQFLANPKKFVGAKTMAYKLKKEDQRAVIIAYLKTLK
ncbi:MAG: c-type cytochrome [Rhodospirillaceae bacterium]|jgi:cytochrome c|nr:c-type cytochrome [Rhodospirillaceae bacterium]MBT5243534.1 c-type cytochrome [Rhodospirillaceae bacterium]MBT5562122.1 c-type cytochrome [Rhodospirillaceae bacterium]MBT6242295.1 c-type cytochrome [Rhodospirillaceae bacterium]MBT7137693.1 c-type cytochrome [Rhodospirillaceae bacterium]